MAAHRKFVRVADPRQGPGEPVQEGWQKALWMSMTQAMSSGQEQVVMVVSRQGCPWCDRLVPVLQRAVEKRAALAEEAGGAGLNLLTAPLRVFVYDAQEFAPIIEKLRVEGFPTILVFGVPGVQPVMYPGYVDDENFERLVNQVAEAQPEPEGGRKRRRFLGIFR